VLSWGTEHVEMVWHQEVGADQPVRGFLPSLMEEFLGSRGGKPTASVQSDNGQENGAILMGTEEDAGTGVLSPSVCVRGHRDKF
jgi:hypothetical protein